MTPEQREHRRVYMAEYRKRPGRMDRQRAQEHARRATWTTERRAAEHEKRRLYTQRIREAGVHTVTLAPKSWFDQMLVAQGGVCAICRKPESSVSGKGRVRRLSIDHDHSTRRPRALLCSRCNSAISWLRDDPDTAYAAAEYLRWQRKVDAMDRLNTALGGPQGHRVPELSRVAAAKMQEALG